MTTSLTVIPVADLTPSEYKELGRLSFRNEGDMYPALQNARHGESRYAKAKAVVLRDKDSNKLLSWALVVPAYRVPGKWEFMIYTRATERRKGYGKLVYSRAAKVARGKKRLIVFPHDTTATNFYKIVHDPKVYVKHGYYESK